MKKKDKHKPIGPCHSCRLNLHDHCWLHASPREQWQDHKRCPSFENEEAYREFEEWKKKPSVEGRDKPHLHGSRKNPYPFESKRDVDRRHMSALDRRKAAKLRPEQAILVQIAIGRSEKAQAEDSLRELARLADTAGARVVGQVLQKRTKPTRHGIAGAGKLEEIQGECLKNDAGLVIFDNELSPAEVNRYSGEIGVKVMDRTQLILDIFAKRARTAEAKIQVEMARLQHLLSAPPRGGAERGRGGIGVRGPGESPLHRGKAVSKKRIQDLQRKLALIQKRRVQSLSRAKCPQVSIVGYTNAGKSTLLNALASAEAYVDDRLFATLDTRSRMIRLPDGSDVMLSDTVGFIRQLPHALVASFRSTLGVAAQADLLLVVADASDARIADQVSVVRDTLDEIGAGQVESLLLLNKCDTLADEDTLQELQQEHSGGIPISALRGEGLMRLKEEIASRMKGGGRADK